MASSKCPKGAIRRVGYNRKAHERRAYTKKNGEHVNSSYVHRSHTEASCVPAKGKALLRGAKTPSREKVLPKIGKEISLSLFGYKTSFPESQRHTALKKAAKHYGQLKTLRHLNLIRNYEATGSPAKSIMAKDVEFLSILHKKQRVNEGKTVRKTSGSKRSKEKISGKTKKHSSKKTSSSTVTKVKKNSGSKRNSKK